jgi:hypothetical protein
MKEAKDDFVLRTASRRLNGRPRNEKDRRRLHHMICSSWSSAGWRGPRGGGRAARASQLFKVRASAGRQTNLEQIPFLPRGRRFCLPVAQGRLRVGQRTSRARFTEQIVRLAPLLAVKRPLTLR